MADHVETIICTPHEAARLVPLHVGRLHAGRRNLLCVRADCVPDAAGMDADGKLVRRLRIVLEYVEVTLRVTDGVGNPIPIYDTAPPLP